MQRSKRRILESLESRRLMAIDVAITLGDLPEGIVPGGDVSYTLAISNLGDAAVEQTHVSLHVDGAAELTWRRSSHWPARVDLADVDDVAIARIDSPSPNGSLGDGLSSAGDVNEDGFDDLLIGASGRAGLDPAIGNLYLLFGAAEFGNSQVSPNLQPPAGQVLVRTDVPRLNASTSKMAGGSDFNGDGFVDLILAAPAADADDFRSGELFMLYGSSAGFAEDLDFLSLLGQSGSRILGVAAGDIAGSSVDFAGDVNGDGISDVVIGAPGASPEDVNHAGEAYVIFGSQQGLGSDFDLADLNGTNGFVLYSGLDSERLGTNVASAGDVNGDGYGDIVLGTTTDTSYVVLGSNQGFDARISVSELSSNIGFEVRGAARLIESIGSAGDFNGDGLDDLVFGVPAPKAFNAGGTAHVVFGRAADLQPVDLTALDGQNGFTIVGGQLNDQLGTSVAGIGDLNGDGVDDIALGAPNAKGGGPSSTFPAGEAYVLFGSQDPFAAEFSTAQLNGANGFSIHGTGASSRTGETISSAGDTNGDGVVDVLIGVPSASTQEGGEGQVFVIFGRHQEVSGQGAIEDIVSLGVGEVVQYTVTASADDDATAALAFSATVSVPEDEGQADMNPEDNSIAWSLPILAPPLVGDIDLDGHVSFADFLILSANFGQTEGVGPSDGDLDGDGQVGFSDFLLLAANFGQ